MTQVTAMLDLITIFSAAGLQQELKAANGDKSLMISEARSQPNHSNSNMNKHMRVMMSNTSPDRFLCQAFKPSTIEKNGSGCGGA